ncbi:iron-sulfur cluster repair di-iron protein [Niabella drilacis]|uniref:Regulator of cell morphogenesis and NO signaling n=1 Tax=Niabella drilacis (strain DSM 25811 / CCM 8410 / CCUG 62505 / LMG 26954 / E90) TaxID=1285928 RepID=A0A1G6IHY7_NIADE|nr:iron-sulfur cluster repair di-iron protein [Niabella drilacis]SDC06051.1 regulator of cell morphogenesis and NO signaling [Niabella drilacis]
MDIHEQTVIGALVAEDYRTASVFKSYGIDFCCNGNRTIGEACRKKELEPGRVLRALEEAHGQVNTATAAYNNWPADLLADYIEKKHHRYVTAKIAEITPFLEKVTRVHGDRHPELKEVAALFRDSAVDLSAHMKKEEAVLFPYIRSMVANGTVHAAFGTVENPISVMMHEHHIEGERFEKIAALTGNYTPPADACNTYRVTFSLLKEFEEDLHLHVHLENNILFPRAIRMEQERSS